MNAPTAIKKIVMSFTTKTKIKKSCCKPGLSILLPVNTARISFIPSAFLKDPRLSTVSPVNLPSDVLNDLYIEMVPKGHIQYTRFLR